MAGITERKLLSIRPIEAHNVVMEWLAFRMVPRSAKDLTKKMGKVVTSLESITSHVNQSCLCEDLFYELQIREVAEILVKIPFVSDREG